jgi:phage baseplate assembly protein V
MRRSTPMTAGHRISMTVTRATLEKTNDDLKMQEGDFKLLHDEQSTEIEHIHPYGFTARPKSPSEEGGKKRKAEAVVIFPNGGTRSHGIALVVGDRRYRLKSMKEGEVALHDDQGQKVHLTRDGMVLEAPKKITAKVDKAVLTIEKDKITGVVDGKGMFVAAKDHSAIKIKGKPAMHVTVDDATDKITSGKEIEIAPDPHTGD